MKAALRKKRVPGDCSSSIPIGFREAVLSMVDGLLSEDRFFERMTPYIRAIAAYQMAQWRRWYHTEEVEDLVQEGLVEAARRLGLTRSRPELVWDPDHNAEMSAPVYVYRSVSRRIQNRLKQSLKYRDRSRPPVVHIPSARVTTPGLDERHVDSDYRIDVETSDALSWLDGDEPVRLPDGWERDLVRATRGRVAPDERATLRIVLSAIESGCRIDDILIDAGRNPERYGVETGRELADILRSVGSRKWRRRRRKTDPPPLVRPRAPGYDQCMTIRHMDEPTDDQLRVLDLVPARERDQEAIRTPILARTIDALEAEVANRYTDLVRSGLTMARLLWAIDEHELWRIDDRYRSFGDFVGGALATGAPDRAVSRSSAYELLRAYRAALEFAERADRTVEELWDEIGTTKLQLLADSDVEIKERLAEIAFGGGTRNEMKAAKRELLEGRVEDDGIDDAEIVDEEHRADPPDRYDDDSEDESDTTITLAGRVLDGRTYRLVPRDKTGEHDSLAGMDVAEAAGRAYCTHRPHPSIEIGFGFEVRDGRVVGGELVYNRVARKS